jgi:uncharacterized protein (TIGR03083 family)
MTSETSPADSANRANLWLMVNDERKALVADLKSLTEEEWRTQSLCALWTVRDVLAHMTATASTTPARFLAQFACSGFRFHVMNQRNLEREIGENPADTLARFESHLYDTTAPPGGVDSILGDLILHGEDIRRPLGISHRYPLEAVIRVANSCKDSNLLLGSKRRIAGLTLRATDTPWSTGVGPVVAGPAVSLLLAMTGRTSAQADLRGEGLATLEARY